jgi:predicted nucleotide-binding protein (sugar kinase/HSP70/actin superfamily)
MKVTFPHMGNMYIAIKVLLDTVGIDYIIPPNCNKKTLEYGIKHSPECICLPFKVVLGSFIECMEKGADYILFGSGCGQCRFGYYGDLIAEIISSLGYKTKVICLETASMSFKDVVTKLKPFVQGKSIARIVRGVIYGLYTVFAVDKLYQLANYTRCREKKRGSTDNYMNEFHKKVVQGYGFKAVNNLIKDTSNRLKALEVDLEFNPLKVGLVGEIYGVNETFVNLDIEKKLGNLGVEVHNTLVVSAWIKEHFINNLLPFKRKNTSHEAGKEFMKTDDIGGHGLETIGHSILYGKNNFDGVIQLYPLTCMPEIVAQSTFSEIQAKYDIPIMTLIVDEMTGEAGYLTRIEAFVDMLEWKRQIKNKERKIFSMVR